MTSTLPVASCWILTEKLTGLQNQAIGLACALGIDYVMKEIEKPSNIWLKLFARKHNFLPPWPDLIISCGQNSASAALAIRRASAGKTFVVHIQNPHVDLKQFDVVIAPYHDHLRGPNVFVTQGAVHHVTQEKLMSAACHFRPLLAPLPRPVISVLVGGMNRHQKLSFASVDDLAQKLRAGAVKVGGSLAITPSRRTGQENIERLKWHFKDMPTYLWDGQGENPYFGLLAFSDWLVVTSDSISMISEACFTGKPVYVYELPGGGKRHKEFLGNLARKGIVRPFVGEIEKWEYTPLDETRRAADFVSTIFLAKGSGRLRSLR